MNQNYDCVGKAKKKINKKKITWSKIQCSLLKLNLYSYYRTINQRKVNRFS